MPIQTGDRLGAYEILSTLGAGGMGIVYRARDVRLGRDVAIKMLPEDVAADSDRLARFEREARALAALNHVNVASIYGFERDGAHHLLVMELVEGETLADWIARGPISIERALPLFVQIAEGLEAAHTKGIIHRDLKPANIKIAASASAGSREVKPGAVKILDFGLAKALAPEPQGQATNASHSPTLTLQATMRGELLGTAGYMSPEQAEGEPADQRADIWAFAVCLLEALTGRPVFAGSNASRVLASVLKDEPDLAMLPPATPPSVRRLLRRCLDKDRDQRLHDIADARLELEEALAAPAVDHESIAAPTRPTGRLWIAVAVGAGIALGMAGSWLIGAWRRPPSGPASIARFVLNAAPAAPASSSTQLSNLAITRDGRTVVYVTGDLPATTFLVRSIDQLGGTALQGVEPGAIMPFLSPDNRWLGYHDLPKNSLRKIPILGGPSLEICKITAVFGASWGLDDAVIFGQLTGPLQSVPAAGGEPKNLTQLAEGEVAHRFPEILPGGDAVLFAAFGGAVQPANATIEVLQLESGERKVILAGATQPRYAMSGHLLYTVGATLYAVGFDTRNLEMVGEPVAVVDGVANTTFGAARYTVSEAGALAYVSGGMEALSNVLVWVDREGREELVGAPPRNYLYPRLSPDGTRVALDVRDEGGDIWIWDLERETPTRLTLSPRTDQVPIWSLDGRTVFFAAQEESGDWSIVGRLADGTGASTRVIEQGSFYAPASVTNDGGGLIAMRGRSSGTFSEDIVWVDIAGKAQPRVLLDSESHFTNPELSPDGRWLAYQSDESGAYEVYVRPFPAVDAGSWQISSGGGTRPLWSRDGTELFYLTPSGFLTATKVEHRADALVFGRSEVVIAKTYANVQRPGRTYDVSPDGRRFLMIKSNAREQQETGGRIVLVQNFLDEVRRVAPARSGS